MVINVYEVINHKNVYLLAHYHWYLEHFVECFLWWKWCAIHV